MQTSNENQLRRFDIDWLRIALIGSVFIYHIGMFFNSFGWHVKNDELVTWLDPIMSYLHRWRMPLLFFVSGVGTYYALGRKNIWQYIKERHSRLMIPLIFGMFFIVPPQVYVEFSTRYDSFLSFIPHITEGMYPEGNFSWLHLWFVLYLFVCSLALIPFIILFKSSMGKKILSALSRFFTIKGSLLVLSLLIYMELLLLKDRFPWETHAFFNDWAYWGYNFLFFAFGYILYSDSHIMQSIVNQRKINGIVALLFTALFFFDYYISIDPWVPDVVQLLLGSILEWSIAIAMLGHFGKYFNKDLPIRKYLNEAIYPFYILHQTVIIVIGFNLVNSPIPMGIKAIILTLASFTITVAIYWFIVRPFNVTRVLFGMRVQKHEISMVKRLMQLKKAS